MLALGAGGRCARRPLPAVASSKIQTRYLTIGIRRETKGRWERRAPLNPADVKRLVKDHGAKVLVQPSSRRVFNDDKYAEAGAAICEDLRQADVVMGIKEVEPADMIPGKTYMYFSHTHKGQPHNMHMLKSVLDKPYLRTMKKIRLLDYELITDDERRRLVLFGRYAGLAGHSGVCGFARALLRTVTSTSTLRLNSRLWTTNLATHRHDRRPPWARV
ncbi:MAG: hypothetical protein BJ554DRAFT_6987 [Olpidium bornovanus]|uniref:Alanine dehydrogenase/pyridine nucleotide transhydrogenase N-terminal domain-containing protein n=1 Tax=Olpidium bornovanus TaxID=278681 RepID=A0A8H7ZX88_9FUNG|nr:MAG: hypothetical protein BJ554DRAFT_6987 [Olpidium bornovanus]